MTDAMLQLREAIAEVHKHLPGQHDQQAHGGHDLTDISQKELDALHMEHVIVSLEAQTAVSQAAVRLDAATKKMRMSYQTANYARAKQEVEDAQRLFDDAEDAYAAARRDMMTLPIYAKHLPGKHDQKEHGRKDLAVAEKNVSVRVIDQEIADWNLASIFKGRSVPSTDAIAKAYSGGLDRLPTGTKVKLTIKADTDYDGGISVEINGRLVYQGKQIGRFDRTISRKGSNVQAYHDALYMNKAYQGAGFGSEFFYHSEHAYRLMGVDEIRTVANDKVGGYAWAKMGFEFAYKEDRASTVSKIANKIQDMYDEHVRKNKLAGEEPKWHDEKLDFEDKERSLAEKLSSKVRSRLQKMKYPYQLAAVKVKMPDGEKHRVGKVTMVGHDWAAVKYLSRAPSPAVKAGNKYRRRRRKALMGRKKVIS